MNPNNEYDDHSALDAPDHLSKVLERFFYTKAKYVQIRSRETTLW